MTSFLPLNFLLLLLLHTACTERIEQVFRAEGDVIEMGYCFGMSHIVVYKEGPEGFQLLGNSSADATPITLPPGLQGRVRITNKEFLLGLQISSLTHSDAGIFRKECWHNQTLVNQLTYRLTVCDREIAAEEIKEKEEDGRTGAALLCNRTSAGMEGTSIYWFLESAPDYKAELLLNSNRSLDLLVDELNGVVEVKDHGALLWIPSSVLEDSPQFYCVVTKGLKCLSFQNKYLMDKINIRIIFASHGDKVVLNCTTDHKEKEWLTPLGRINETTKLLTSADGFMKSNHIYILGVNDSQLFSLVISNVSDIHRGEYNCHLLPFFEVQYELILCPKKEPQRQTVTEGGNVTLECNIGKNESVQWNRRGTSGEDELIQIKPEEIPKDLRGRVSWSEHGSSLTLSSLTIQDIRTVYWCIVLGSLAEYEYYEDYDDEEDAAEDDNEDDEFWPQTHRCIFKQEIVLQKKIEGRRPPGLTSAPPVDPPADPPTAMYGVMAGLAALLVLVVGIAVVIVIKKGAKASPRQKASAAGSGLGNANFIEMRGDPAAERLTQPTEQLS